MPHTKVDVERFVFVRRQCRRIRVKKIFNKLCLKTLEGSVDVEEDDLGFSECKRYADLNDLDRFFVDAGQAFGGLDLLVVNAGVYSASALDETTPEFFDRMSAVNFRGAFFTVQRALPLLRESASVILVTSTINESGVPGLAVYAATKAAVRSLARGLAAELMPRKIRVNALSPGIIDTPIFGRLGMEDQQVEGLKSDLEDQVPMGRLGTPDEIARAAVFLASDDSSYMTGCELPVSGGLGQI